MQFCHSEQNVLSYMSNRCKTGMHKSTMIGKWKTAATWLLAMLMLANTSMAQRQKADSIAVLLQNEKVDTNRVRLLWQQANYTSLYAPDTALGMAQNALFLARRIQYTEGESKALGIVANTFLVIGNYSRALDFYLQKLQLEEKRQPSKSLASVNMNIGIVYANTSEYALALKYYMKADSINRSSNAEDVRYKIALNLGDLYDRLELPDSSLYYFNRAMVIARLEEDSAGAAIAMVGLGNSYRQIKMPDLAIRFYQGSLLQLQAANEEDIMCEATMGLAKVYESKGLLDSSLYYAGLSFQIAKRGDFLARQLTAADFLTQLAKKQGNLAQTLQYLELTQSLKDTIYSKEKIREAIVLSSNEQQRQLELEEERKKAAEERSQQLQYLLICIFIPLTFLLTILLSRKRVKPRLIRFLGIISLLFLFEFLTLLLHPRVAELTNHNPVLELLIFVAIASFIIPSHHRIEHWMVQKLTQRRDASNGFLLKLRTIKLRIKKPSRI